MVSDQQHASLYTFTIILTVLSVIFSFFAFWLHHSYSSRRPSPFQQLVSLLILSDGLGSLCFVIWIFLDINDKGGLERYHCRIIWPFANFFFLLSFGWTSLIARRFHYVNQVNSSLSGSKDYNTPLWIIPVLCGILVVPIIIANAVFPWKSASEVVNPANSNQDVDFCFFASNPQAIAINFTCFLLPSFIAILYNAGCYYAAIRALKDSPYSVGHNIWLHINHKF
jgi:hypothetical protein